MRNEEEEFAAIAGRQGRRGRGSSSPAVVRDQQEEPTLECQAGLNSPWIASQSRRAHGGRRRRRCNSERSHCPLWTVCPRNCPRTAVGCCRSRQRCQPTGSMFAPPGSPVGVTRPAVNKNAHGFERVRRSRLNETVGGRVVWLVASVGCDGLDSRTVCRPAGLACERGVGPSCLARGVALKRRERRSS